MRASRSVDLALAAKLALPEIMVDRKLQKSWSIPLTLSPLSFPFLSSSLFSFPLSSLSSQIPSGPIGAAGLQPTCRQRGAAVAAAGDSGAAGRVGRGGEARGRRGGAPPREGRRAAAAGRLAGGGVPRRGGAPPWEGRHAAPREEARRQGCSARREGVPPVWEALRARSRGGPARWLAGQLQASVFFLFSFLLQKFFTIFFIWIFLGFGCNFFYPKSFLFWMQKKSYPSFFCVECKKFLINFF